MFTDYKDDRIEKNLNEIQKFKLQDEISKEIPQLKII